MDKNSNDQTENPSTTLPGVVQKIIPSPDPKAPEKAEIGAEGGARFDMDLLRENGQRERLKLVPLFLPRTT